ncbi:efflux RND transporter periplasmic adaptor subunit [Sphingobium sp. AR-3-1]|uniref:Efflux RND transporter periplasmic adaptor subunit n=1 Tax=Sphingobium psychrophilum TaxID=2728834 RepID=A0A7X9ZRU0_9SPHN|nr:efflux RND transporter periplasmic adaptor subunit [Sphingobium psychrophilum]NML10360.1 efflux RND transporter periplasmic adaptor subunit [Sphingobium psychrophilum]
MTNWVWLASASLALASCGGKEEAEPASATLPAGESLKLAASDIADMKAVGAEITTRDSAEALARISGTLVSLSVREGDMVEKGQRIGMIVDARLGYETSAYGAQIAAAQAEAARARGDLARVQDLYNNKVYAKARLDQAVAMSRAADAQVAAARAQQGASASVAGQGAILAPASGRVLRADIPAGSVVAPGMSVATITAGPPLLRLELPESLAGQVRSGAQILVADGDPPDGSRQGRVTQVYPAVTGGRVRVDATVPGLSTQLVGRRAGVSIEVGRRRALIVPRRFVSTRYGIDQVDVVTADRRVSAVPVQVAPTANPDSIEILSGVAAGDTLFLAGARK